MERKDEKRKGKRKPDGTTILTTMLGASLAKLASEPSTEEPIPSDSDVILEQSGMAKDGEPIPLANSKDISP